jgi:hypothetical protein
MAKTLSTSGLRNESLLDNISRSGSLVVSKDSPNSYTFQEINQRDGVVFGKLENPK